MDLRQKIENYIPFNEQEEKDKEQFLKFIDTFDDVLTRDNIFGHFSASAFVVNKERNKMVVVYHIINDGWIYPGGHADGEDDFLSVAVREVEEETGLKVKILDENIAFLKRQKGIKEVICIPQVRNLEDELVRACNIKNIVDLTKSLTKADYKRDLINCCNLSDRLKKCKFDITKIWAEIPKNNFKKYGNDSEKIKIKSKK